jgi:hypothetical protein
VTAIAEAASNAASRIFMISDSWKSLTNGRRGDGDATSRPDGDDDATAQPKRSMLR